MYSRRWHGVCSRLHNRETLPKTTSTAGECHSPITPKVVKIEHLRLRLWSTISLTNQTTTGNMGVLCPPNLRKFDRRGEGWPRPNLSTEWHRDSLLPAEGRGKQAGDLWSRRDEKSDVAAWRSQSIQPASLRSSWCVIS
jgi:hypothetical protein